MWKNVNKEVLDKGQYIVPLKKGELQIKYAEALVKIDKVIEYIEKCLEQTPTENREKTDDILDMEYRYILDILKEEK